MNKIYLFAALTLLLFAVTGAVAQVGIGTPTPAASAMLDVSSTNKGVLLPRIALTGTGDNTTIAAPQTSLLVYNTASAGSGNKAVTPGYYYWNGSAWERLTINSSLSASSWALKGNAGTSSATNFIGTTDNQPLVFKVNKQLAGKLTNSGFNTSWGIGTLAANTTGLGNTASGYQALFSNTTGSHNTASGYQTLFSNTTGIYNTANGDGALYKNTGGSYNTASGYAALYANTTGTNNIGIGESALFSNTTGSFNTASGRYALTSNVNGSSNTAYGANALYFDTGSNNTATGYRTLFLNTTGSGNTANGMSALFNNTTGSNNTALGYAADVTSDDLTNATAIGYNAKVGCSDCLVLGNADVNVGIGTRTPGVRLEVNGDAKFNGTVSTTGTFDMGITTISEEFVARGSCCSVAAEERKLGCPIGYTLIGGGGGGKNYSGGAQVVVVNYSGPDLNNDNVWRLLVTNISGGNTPAVIFVKCAKVK